MSRVRRFFRTYKPFTRAGMQEMIAYRANFICFLIGEIMSAFIMYFVWKAVFLSTDRETFMGFTMEDMAVYLFISFLTGYLTYSDGAFSVGEEIIDGSIAMRMIKPCSFEMCFLFQELGSRIISVAMIFVPMVAGVEIYRCAVSGFVRFQIGAFLLYIVSLLLAYMISFYFNVCYGFMAFFFKNLWGTTLIKETVVNFLSGAIIPLAFLPSGLAAVLNILPFASLSYTPVMIYMGMYSTSQILWSFGLQLFWLVVMFGISKLIWRGAVKHLSIQGG
ncbi:MAG: ABC-2 family transporter protein [Ruminococcus sp.]|nr:ABC-2 family transporter protein [Ruminococcus sp.]